MKKEQGLGGRFACGVLCIALLFTINIADGQPVMDDGRQLSSLDSVIYDYLKDVDNYKPPGGTEFLRKIEFDLDQDGLTDVLLSGHYKGGWGNAGGEWTVYYQTSKSVFKKCQETFFMYPDVSRYDLNNHVLMSYHRLGCCLGSIGFFKIENCSFKLVENKRLDEETGIVIHEEISKEFIGMTEFKMYTAEVIPGTKEWIWR